MDNFKIRINNEEEHKSDIKIEYSFICSNYLFEKLNIKNISKSYSLLTSAEKKYRNLQKILNTTWINLKFIYREKTAK